MRSLQYGNYPLLVFGILTVCMVVGCTISCGGHFDQKSQERIEHQSVAAAGVEQFVATSHNGAIRIVTHDADTIDLTAMITGKADSNERAKEITELAEVSVNQTGNKLSIRLKKPTLNHGESIGASYDIKMPANIALNLEAHNGKIDITGIQQSVNAVTHNGGIKIQDVTGSVKVKTHNGPITCVRVSSALNATTHNGGITVQMNEQVNGHGDCRLVTHNGSINLETSTQYCANVYIKTRNGKIHTDKPILMSGQITRELKGQLGEGEPTCQLHVETYNGSIRIH